MDATDCKHENYQTTGASHATSTGRPPKPEDQVRGAVCSDCGARGSVRGGRFVADL